MALEVYLRAFVADRTRRISRIATTARQAEPWGDEYVSSNACRDLLAEVMAEDEDCPQSHICAVDDDLRVRACGFDHKRLSLFGPQFVERGRQESEPRGCGLPVPLWATAALTHWLGGATLLLLEIAAERARPPC